VDLETWFPLAVGSADLAPSPEQTAAMLSDLQPEIAAAAIQRRLGFAWTGDVNECGQVHERAAFVWLRAEVAREATSFAQALGCDLKQLRVEVQSSWPVLSEPHETVASHTHLGAQLSAVYYLSVPEGHGGTLVFENVGLPNSLGAEFGEPGTPLTRAANPLNLREANYTPREGRLLLFPARQPHAVRAHEGETLRISITFDLVLVPVDA
jgi:uncharacterized protein (TIGR02466 family)